MRTAEQRLEAGTPVNHPRHGSGRVVVDMGATVIVTGLSSEIAQTLVTIGVDLAKMRTVGDLQGGIEDAERLLGYQIVRTAPG